MFPQVEMWPQSWKWSSHAGVEWSRAVTLGHSHLSCLTAVVFQPWYITIELSQLSYITIELFALHKVSPPSMHFKLGAPVAVELAITSFSWQNSEVGSLELMNTYIIKNLGAFYLFTSHYGPIKILKPQSPRLCCGPKRKGKKEGHKSISSLSRMSYPL